MPDADPSPSRRTDRLTWPIAAGLMPFWFAWIAWSWWSELHQQTAHAVQEDATLAATMSATTMAVSGWLGRLSAAGMESAAYVLWWRSRGERLPFWRFFAWVVALSVSDLFGFALRRAAADVQGLLPLLAHVLGGPGPVDGPATSGLDAAFGNLGVLTMMRIGMTAWAQAAGTGRPPLQPLVLTGAAWLLTRLAMWWSFDLLRGMSPVR